MGLRGCAAVWVEELDRFVITCTAYGPAGPAVYLATTKDFLRSNGAESWSVRRTRTRRCCPSASGESGSCSTGRPPASACPAPASRSPAPTISRAGTRRRWSWNREPAPGGIRSGSGSGRPPENRPRLAADLPRRQGNRVGRDLPGRPGAARSRGADPSSPPRAGVGVRTARRVRTPGRRGERDLPVWADPRCASRASYGSTTERLTSRSVSRPPRTTTCSRRCALAEREHRPGICCNHGVSNLQV